uniref:Uncharacterized protein n=4 Tax=Enterobacterales TaxID=91347 RepID=A0A1W5T8D6_KLEPN|nr:Hypothetical protein pKp41M_00056 [Klebsiella pneumoniae]
MLTDGCSWFSQIRRVTGSPLKSFNTGFNSPDIALSAFTCCSRGATAKSLIAFRCDYYTSNEPYKSSNKYMPGMIFSGRGILPFPVYISGRKCGLPSALHARG